jgi:hypothetical protein
VVSSYIPSLQSLLRDKPPVTDQFEVMVVIQPDIPNGNPLPYTKFELRRIEERVPSDFLHVLGVKGVPATVQNVLSHLSTSHIVHFACHGRQDGTAPLNSSLILHGGDTLKVSEIMKQPMPNASLAFLCACETAMGAEDLPDEAMHVAASLLFAGFRGVVATMWYAGFLIYLGRLTYCKCYRSIADEDGPKITEGFYEYLFRGSTNSESQIQPNTTDAALALHHAVSKLRADTNCSFRRWVPFIHMGMCVCTDVDRRYYGGVDWKPIL